MWWSDHTSSIWTENLHRVTFGRTSVRPCGPNNRRKRRSKTINSCCPVVEISRSKTYRVVQKYICWFSALGSIFGISSVCTEIGLDYVIWDTIKLWNLFQHIFCSDSARARSLGLRFFRLEQAWLNSSYLLLLLVLGPRPPRSNFFWHVCWRTSVVGTLL